MSKHPNPVRGHVSCPVCHSHSTVHRVGEGKLIAEGEPTKNGRNLGLLYYKCPDCGNSPMSKSINAFVESNMVDSVEGLPSSDPVTIEANLPTVEPTPKTVESLDKPDLPAIEQRDLPTVEVTTPVDESAPPTPTQKAVFPVKKVLVGVALVTLLLWAIRQLVPTKKTNRANNQTRGTCEWMI